MAINLRCDRCAAMTMDEIERLVDDAYLVDDPATASGHLCPDCAGDDDPAHIAGSWLLTWTGDASGMLDLDPEEEESLGPGNPADYGDRY